MNVITQVGRDLKDTFFQDCKTLYEHHTNKKIASTDKKVTQATLRVLGALMMTGGFIYGLRTVVAAATDVIYIGGQVVIASAVGVCGYHLFQASERPKSEGDDALDEKFGKKHVMDALVKTKETMIGFFTQAWGASGAVSRAASPTSAGGAAAAAAAGAVDGIGQYSLNFREIQTV